MGLRDLRFRTRHRLSGAAARRRGRLGLTLMELLVVISIIGMVMALSLPAVQASREAARLNTCKNNLREAALALLNHESAFRRFPSGGWGFRWYGDPDRGTGLSQPGGWTFALLPYLERSDLARLGAGEDAKKKQLAVAAVNGSPLSLFLCPSRRALAAYPFHPAYPPYNAALEAAVAKTDYAINGGDVLVHSFPGPETLRDGDSPSFKWPDMSKATGICHLRSEVVLAQIRDGTSHTYMIGEKHLVPSGDPGDDQALYVGYDWDTVRWANAKWTPWPDSAGAAPQRFGSAHPQACQFAFCDGSVHEISFGIDGAVHRRLGNRQDGQPIDDSLLESP